MFPHTRMVWEEQNLIPFSGQQVMVVYLVKDCKTAYRTKVKVIVGLYESLNYKSNASRSIRVQAAFSTTKMHTCRRLWPSRRTRLPPSSTDSKGGRLREETWS